MYVLKIDNKVEKRRDYELRSLSEELQIAVNMKIFQSIAVTS